MKGAFETYVIFLFGMMFVLMGMNFTQLILFQNNARLYAENILSIIEHQNRYDLDVESLIQQSPVRCLICSHTITYDLTRYHIEVTYPFKLVLFNIDRIATIELFSRPLD